MTDQSPPASPAENRSVVVHTELCRMADTLFTEALMADEAGDSDRADRCATNSRVLSAASRWTEIGPEMLEALRKIAYAPPGASGPSLAECIDIARALIDRAEGRS